MPKTTSTTRIRRKYPDGLTTRQLIDEVNDRLPRPIKTPTIRRYVQLGLVNATFTSVGTGRGSGRVGMYSAETVEQVLAAYRSLHEAPIGTTRADALVLCQVRAARARAIVAAREMAVCAARQAKRLANKAIGRRLASSAKTCAQAAVRALKSAC